MSRAPDPPKPEPVRPDGARESPGDSTNSDLRQGSAHQKRIIDALYRVNNLMAEVTDLNQLLNLILVESKNVLDVEASSLMLYDEERDDLYFEVALGEKGEQVKVIRLKMGEGIAGSCAKERRTLVVNDTARDDRHFKLADEITKFKTRNILATPLVRKGRLIGVLEVLNKSGNRPFTEADVKVIEFFADHVAIAVENALLVKANLRAERLAALGQAVASISHYVKNILQGVRGSASLIDHALETDNFDMVREAWPILKRSNAKIASLVENMLTFSKDREPNPVRANLNRLAEEVVEMVAVGAAESGVALETCLDPDMPDSMFDAERLHDAVLNLVTNAIDAVRDCPGPRVVVRTRFDRDAGRILVSVEDNGPGIPEEIRRKIFEPFFSTKGSKGTGLGLAVANKVVRENGGELLLDSEVGCGAKFTVVLAYVEPSGATESGSGE